MFRSIAICMTLSVIVGCGSKSEPTAGSTQQALPTSVEGTPTNPAAAAGLKAESAANLKAIIAASALHARRDARLMLPTNIKDSAGTPLLSWRVALLPDLKEGDLHSQFNLKEPWDSEHNKKLIAKIPKVFAPVAGKAALGETFYQGFVGTNTVFNPLGNITLGMIFDGTSSTIFAAEAGTPVIWTKPDDMPFDNKKDLAPLGGMFDDDFRVVMCDGKVFTVKKGFNPADFKPAVTRNEQEIFDTSKVFK